LSTKKKILIIEILLVIAIFSATGVLESFQNNHILPYANTYISSSQGKALEAFITISAIKAIVAVVEGSSIEGLEIGDSVQSLFDAIDITWKIITASLMSLYLIELLLMLCRYMGPALIGFAALLSIVLLFSNKEILRKYIVLTVVVALLTYLVLPMSLYLAGIISENYSEAVRDDLESILLELEGLRDPITFDLGIGTSETEIVGVTFLTPTFQRPTIGIKFDMLNELNDKMEELASILIRTGISWLFDVIVIPFGVIFLLYKALLLFANSFLGSSKADKLQLAVENTMKNYFKRNKRKVSRQQNSIHVEEGIAKD